MPNKNYVSGRSYEYKAKRLLEEQGFTVIRAAGSHGPFDLIAFRDGEPVRMIQVKRVLKEGAMKRLAFDFEEGRGPEQASWVEELWVFWNRKVHKFFRYDLKIKLDKPRKT